jgi:hypothetical protein
MKVSLPNLLATIVCVFACTAMIGDLVGSKVLKGLGAMSGIAPCPKVFCQIKEWESFTCDYILRAESPEGIQEICLSPENYSKLHGPYNRRNAYGAALSFAPILPTNLWQTVFDYGLGINAPLRSELGISPQATNVTILIRPKDAPAPKWTHTRSFQ